MYTRDLIDINDKAKIRLMKVRLKMHINYRIKTFIALMKEDDVDRRTFRLSLESLSAIELQNSKNSSSIISKELLTGYRIQSGIPRGIN